jgi:hypothetical protein
MYMPIPILAKLGKRICAIILFFAVLEGTALFAVNVEPVSPERYSLSFQGDVLPVKAKVVGLRIEIEGAMEVWIRSLPTGWGSTTSQFDHGKYSVGISWFPWKTEKGAVLDLSALNDRVWLQPEIDKNQAPVQPKVSVIVLYAMPPEAGKASSMVKEIPLPPASIKLAYIP